MIIYVSIYINDKLIIRFLWQFKALVYNNIKCVITEGMKFYIDPIASNEIDNKNKCKKLYQDFKPESSQQVQYYQLYHPNIKIFCDICKKDISTFCRIAIEQQDICVHCFANLEEFPDSYKVISNLNRPFTENKWSVLHDLLLLSLIKQWGFGSSWSTIQICLFYFGLDAKFRQILRHYEIYFLKNKDGIPFLPFCDINKQYRDKSNKMIMYYDQSEQDFIESQHSNDRRVTKNSNPNEEIHENQINSINIIGYNAKRKEFQSEYDPDAQKMLAYLEFRNDDTPEQIEAKFKLISEYNSRLDERIKRRQFIIQHRLLDQEYQQNLATSRSKYQKQAAIQLRPFSRFSTLKEHNELVRRIALSNKLKSLIQGFRKCRKINHEGNLSSVINYIKRKREQNSSSKGKGRKIVHLNLNDQYQIGTANNNLEEQMGLTIAGLKKLMNHSQQLNKIGESLSLQSCTITLIKKAKK